MPLPVLTNDLYELKRKIQYQFHKTRLTEDFYIQFSIKEVECLLKALEHVIADYEW